MFKYFFVCSLGAMILSKLIQIEHCLLKRGQNLTKPEKDDRRKRSQIWTILGQKKKRANQKVQFRHARKIFQGSRRMLVGLLLHFLLLLKKRTNVFFFSAYDNTTEGIEQTYYMIYGSIQNVLATGITRIKIEDQVNQTAHFHQDRSSKRKNEISIKSFRRNE